MLKSQIINLRKTPMKELFLNDSMKQLFNITLLRQHGLRVIQRP